MTVSTRQSVRFAAPMILLALLWHPARVRAAGDNSSVSMFSLSGFGTLGVVHSSEDKADFTSTILKPNGAGHSHDWSTDVDSLIAAQLTANATSHLSAVVQVIAEQNYDNTYTPHVEWANIKYQFTPDFSVRFGRTVLPAFLLSETRKVGYTYAWVRPPLEVYLLLPVTSSDGFDLSYRVQGQEWTNTVQMDYGKKDTKLVIGGINSAKDAWGISDTFEYHSLTARITYQHTKLTIAALNSLFDAFRQFGPQGIAIADKYDSDAKPFSFLTVGASYDPGNWFAMAEWGEENAHSTVGRNSAWYASAGYRIHTLTPYLTYAQSKTDNLTDPGLDLAALPPFLAGPAAGLNAALNSVLSTKRVQNTVSLGARWDFMKNTDLKLQFDHTRIGAGSIGELSNPQPGFQLGGKVNVFSATVDFLW